jgi:6-pyruvoyltetrahydropterin/6-carboxytetrahydropterin synthase
MPIARLTRVISFSAAHRYFRPEWSRERNRDVFGQCANEHGHGHNYECYVTLVGPVAEDTGMVIDLSILDAILREEVTDPFDHKFINHDVPDFAFGKSVPTSEMLAVYIWDRVARRLPADARLECVRVQEGPYLYAEYRGEGEHQ